MSEACQGDLEASEDIILDASEFETFTAVPASGSKAVHSIQQRLSAAAGAHIEIDQETYKVIVRSDSLERRRRALKYVRLTQKSNQGWVEISEADIAEDLLVLEVPETLQNIVAGRNNSMVQVVAEDSSAVIFFVDEGRGRQQQPVVEATIANSVPARPSPPWLKEGKKVEVKRLGDIRSGENWQIGIVQTLHRSGNVSVKLESTGLEITAEVDMTRPWYETGDSVEVHIGDGEWKEAVFKARTEDGKAVVTIAEDEFTTDMIELRPLAKEGENLEPASGEAQGEEDTKDDDPAEKEKEEEKEEEAPEEEKERMTRIAIFGSRESQADAAVRLMGLVEMKRPGFFGVGDGCTVDVSRLPWRVSDDDGWGVEMYELTEETKGLCIGAKGIMIKKMRNASGCSLEYLGHKACICGPQAARAACKALLETLISTNRGDLEALPEAAKEYCDIVELPEDIVPFVLGKERANTKKLEEEEGILLFLAPRPPAPAKENASNNWKDDKSWDNWKESDKNWWNEESQGKAEEVKSLSDYVASFSEASPEDLSALCNALSEDAKNMILESLVAFGENDQSVVVDPSDTSKVDQSQDDVPQEDTTKVQNVRKVFLLGYSEKARKRARFRIESLAEQKWEGLFSEHYDAEAASELQITADECQDDVFGITAIEIDREVAQQAIGKKGQRKAKIMAASGCLLEVIGEKLFFVGARSERARARQYMKWFLDQQSSATPDRHVRLTSAEIESRSDVTVMLVTEDEKAKLAKETLQQIEQETGTCIFFREVPENELLSAGGRLLIRRGGCKFPVEVESSEQQDKTIKLTIRICEDAPDAVIEEIKNEALMPVLIFAKDNGATCLRGRGLAERRIKEHLQGCGQDWSEEQPQNSWGQESWKQEEDTSWKSQSRGRKGDDSSHNARDNWDSRNGKQDQHKGWEEDKGWQDSRRAAKEDGASWKNDKNDWNQSKSQSGGQRSREDNGSWGQSRSNDRNGRSQDGGNWNQGGSKSQDGANWQQNKNSDWSNAKESQNSGNGGWVPPPPGHEDRGGLWNNWKGTGGSDGYKDDKDDWASGNGRRKW